MKAVLLGLVDWLEIQYQCQEQDSSSQEQSYIQRQKVERWLPGAGRKDGREESVFRGYSFRWERGKVLERKGSDGGCTTL